MLVAAVHSSAAALGHRQVEVVSPAKRYAPQAKLPAKLVLPIDVRLPAWLAEALAKDAWFLRDQVVVRNGLRLRADSLSVPSTEGTDIAIADASEMSRSSAEIWLGSRRGTARLRILINARFEPLWEPRLVSGTACLVLPTRGNDEAVTWLSKLFFELTHDLPLHHAVSMMRQWARPIASEQWGPVERWLRGPRLYGDPAVDQWFRLSNALPQAIEAATAAYELGLGASIAPFAQRLRGHIQASPEFEAALTELGNLHEATAPLREALGQGIAFDRESSGLLPMSQILEGSREVEFRRQRVLDALSSLRKQPGAIEALERAQERRVDATLAVRYLNQVPRVVGQSEGIPSGARVRLSVHIGQRAEGSIVVGEAPALDPLLPELEGDGAHELDIVLLPKDFVLEGEQSTTRTVRLSRFGGTLPVSWDLVAPALNSPKERVRTGQELWATGAIVELRFSIYFRNQLLQSFSLQTVLGDDYPYWADGTTIVKCDFSQTRRFGSLDRLGKRLINLALNEDQTGLHTLVVKGSGLDAAAVTWDAAFLENYVKVLRDALFESLASNGASLFLRISAIVDADFRLIVDGKSAPSETRRGGAQVLG